MPGAFCFNHAMVSKPSITGMKRSKMAMAFSSWALSVRMNSFPFATSVVTAYPPTLFTIAAMPPRTRWWSSINATLGGMSVQCDAPSGALPRRGVKFSNEPDQLAGVADVHQTAARDALSTLSWFGRGRTANPPIEIPVGRS